MDCLAVWSQASALDTTSEQSNCWDVPHIFRLPAELRNHIYRFALVSISDKTIDEYRFRKPGREPALLSVSRQIRREASPIFWGENIFKAADTCLCLAIHMQSQNRAPYQLWIGDGMAMYIRQKSILRQWLHALGPRRVAMIKRFRLLNDRGTEPMITYTLMDEEKRWYDTHLRDFTEGIDPGDPAVVARIAAWTMLKGLEEEGLKVSSVEPILSRKMRPFDQKFQYFWVRSVEELKKKMSEGVELDASSFFQGESSA